MTDIRKRKRLEMERLAAQEALLPQYRIVPHLNLRPVISRRAKETVVTEAVSSSSDGKLTNIQTRSRLQVVNSGTRNTRDNDPVSSSSEFEELSRQRGPKMRHSGMFSRNLYPDTDSD